MSRWGICVRKIMYYTAAGTILLKMMTFSIQVIQCTEIIHNQACPQWESKTIEDKMYDSEKMD